MIKGFYKPRWEQYFKYVIGNMEQNKGIDQKMFDERMKNWERYWVHATESFPSEPIGDPIVSANQLYEKYQSVINATYHPKNISK